MENQNKQETKSHSLTSEFIPYEQALELKRLGFDEPCYAYYEYDTKLVYTSIVSQNTNSFWVLATGIISAPLYQQAFRWFRENHQASPTIHCMSEQGNSWRYHIPNEGGEQNFNTYEEAEQACLLKLIELAKQEP